MLLRQAVDRGHAIGRVAKLHDQGLRELLERAKLLSQSQAGAVQQNLDIVAPVLQAINRYEYAQADAELKRLTAAIASPKQLVHEVALPLMRVIGERWHEGKCSIAQEHMVTSLLSGLLSSFIRIYTHSDPPARVLFATPRNEHHGFPNLAAAMLTAACGLGVIHLGTDLPADAIVQTARKCGADALLLSVSTTPDREVLGDLVSIARKAPKASVLWIGGATDEMLAALDPRWHALRDFHGLERELIALGGRF
jgi:MerR family transcriptional regulator, light-induced transcriptional regulator